MDSSIKNITKMASKKHDTEFFSLKLPLNLLKSDGQKVPETDCMLIFTAMKKDLHDWQRHLKKVDNLACPVVDILLENVHNLYFMCVIHSDKELEDFYKAAKKAGTPGQNRLSSCLTNYAYEQSFELAIGYELSQQDKPQLIFNVCMSEKSFYEGKVFFSEENSSPKDHDNQNHSSANSKSRLDNGDKQKRQEVGMDLVQPKSDKQGCDPSSTGMDVTQPKSGSKCDTTTTGKDTVQPKSDKQRCDTTNTGKDMTQPKSGSKCDTTTTGKDTVQPKSDKQRCDTTNTGKDMTQPKSGSICDTIHVVEDMIEQFENQKYMKPRSGEYHNDENDQNVPADCTSIRKNFIVRSPYSNTQYVNIRSDSCKELSCQFMWHGDDLYAGAVCLPAQFDEGITYFYEFIYEEFHYFTISREVIKKSPLFRIRNCTVQRDLITEDCFYSHMRDIIFHCSRMKKMQELCLEVEDVCHCVMEMQMIIKCICMLSSNVFTNTQQIITFGIMLGCLCERYSPTILNHLQNGKQLSSVIMHALMYTRLKDLPSSCSSYMPSLCQHLCKIMLGTEFNCVTCMNYSYPFIEEHALQKMVSTYINTKELSINVSVELKKYSLELCQKLYQNYLDGKSTITRSVLEQLLRLLPTEVTFHVIQTLQKRGTNKLSPQETDLQDSLSGCLRTKLLLDLHQIKKDGDISMLIAKVKCIDGKRICCDKLLLEQIEKCLVDVIGLPRLKHEHELEQCIKMLHDELKCFKLIVSQQELLKACAEQSNTTILKCFIALSNYMPLKKAYETLESHIYRTWLQNAIKNHGSRKEDELLCMFQSFCDLYCIPFVRDREDVQNALQEIAKTELKKYEIKELLRKWKPVEDICDKVTAVSEICRNFIEQELHKKCQKSHEMLLCLCGTNDGNDVVLRVNAKTTAQLVCAMIDCLCKKPENGSELEQFINILPDAEFWQIIWKGDGKTLSLVHQNETYKQVNKCIMHVGKLLKSNNVNLKFIKLFLAQKKSVEILLGLHGLAPKEIQDILKKVDKHIIEEKKRITLVKKVLWEISKRAKAVHGISQLIQQIDEIECKLLKGHVTVIEYFEKGYVWTGIEDLPEQCSALEKLSFSNVFWNLCLDLVMSKYTEHMENEICLDILECVRLQFDSTEEILECEDTHHALFFVKCLQKEGTMLYRNAWLNLQNDDALMYNSVLSMFDNANVSKEIIIAENFLKEVKEEMNIHTKQTLERQASRHTIKENINAMKSFLDVFSYNIESNEKLFTAIESYQQLMAGDIANHTFKDVKLCLQTLFDTAGQLSDETVHIMAEIGKSSQLLTFLRTIADEDIRNLIDAVEDISEQQVRETTVSALIDVKRFFSPVLHTVPCIENDSQWLFRTLEKQVSTTERKAVGLPSKISDCRDNLHNLKSLYNNVANRGEQTKEIITNIVKNSSFIFSLDTEANCVNCLINYKQNKVNITKQESTLVDLRSRALLLMNTERLPSESKFNQEEFKSFVDLVDLCLDTKGILFDLYSTGNIKYRSIKNKGKMSTLAYLNGCLKIESQSWNEHMNVARKRYFLLNFIHGVQIHSLFSYLEKSGDEKNVETMLKFIHPEMKAADLKQAYDSCDKSKIEMLELIGQALHLAFPEGGNENVCDIPKDEIIKITDVVHSGSVLVANLDENSVFVVKTLLALFLNTTNRLPNPNQVLFCDKETSWSELHLLIERCIGAEKFYGHKTLYCIANVELLPNSLQFRLVESLQHLKNEKNFLLTVVYRGSKNDPFISELSDYTAKVRPLSDTTIQSIYSKQCPEVCTFTSEIAGLGKTTSVVNYAYEKQRSMVTLHISEPVKKSELVKRINEMNINDYHVLHIDVGMVENPAALDTFLFELIILHYVSCGRQSVYLSTNHVSIEIANTINDRLRNSLQTVVSFKKRHIVWNDFEDFKVSTEINSPVQVVCKYLQTLEDNTIDKVDILFNGPNQALPLPQNICRNLMKKYLDSSGEISFSMVHIFLNVLSDQLKKMSCSSFFRVKQIADMIGASNIPTIRSTLFRAMLDVSREFASRSVNACRSTQVSTLSIDNINESKESTETSLTDNAVKRVDGMIRWEESNHLIYVFHNQNIQTLSPMYRSRDKVPYHIRQLFESQMKRNMNDFENMSQDKLQLMLQMVARSNPEVLTAQKLTEIAEGYALTPDNLLKMVLIMMRIKAKVPVMIMGETGCGKTSLIRYLAKICEVPFEVLNIHAGVSTDIIIQTVMAANANCLKTLQKEHWLFLDEINTSENISLIADIICHHRFFGKLLAPNLTIIGACNPYKLRTKHAILTAGLEGKVKTDELSKLVYRVLPLPEMMVDYVWDFGSLSTNDEEKYIDRMVEGVFKSNSNHHSLFRHLISVSQTFVRNEESSSCVVSLRDVQRCRTLVEWFLKILPQKDSQSVHDGKPKMKKWDINIKAIILSLAHCYHSRFADKSVRAKYRSTLSAVFYKTKEYQQLTDIVIQDIITEEQIDILERMELLEGTAKNNALQENVFVLLVCILNRMPIFLVGKPGCSKSLAMQIIRSNLRGKDSKDDFFKSLPQLYCVSFQGSESSTSDGIVKVFDKAEKYQKANSKEDVLSVVILDEIGLAEVSKFNPLKVLHNLLEPGGKSRPDVAVVGISNWSLDASKMNRAIHLSRPEMDADELYETGISISESFTKSVTKTHGMLSEEKCQTLSTEDISTDLEHVAKSYYCYTKNLIFKHFHGLRDFYSLVKFISREFANRKSDLSSQEKSDIILQGLERNFGGLPKEQDILLDEFKSNFSELSKPNKPVMELVTSNVQDQLARHLMLITKGEAVLGIIEQHLYNIGREEKEVIVGSQFEEDLTDDYNYRILSKIILCMEEGIILILKDLDSVYGSLYDMLNQNYTVIGKKKNCRIALGPYSNPICHVANSFRCIVLVNEQQLDYSDPPFLNRFEKQQLSFADILSNKQMEIVNYLELWLDAISKIDGKSFTKEDVFPIYSKELIPSLVLLLDKEKAQNEKELHELDTKCKQELLWIMKPDAVVRVQRCDDDHIRENYDEIKCQYFDLPVNAGIADFVEYQIAQAESNDSTNKMTVVFTNSNIHTKVFQNIGRKVQIEKLGSFKSEKQLSLRIQQFWSDTSTSVLFVQCSAVEDERHILLTKSIIEHFRKDFNSADVHEIQKYVYLIIHLEKSMSKSYTDLQINYLSGWKLVMLDTLECPSVPLLELCESRMLTVIAKKRPLSNCIREELFWALARIRYGMQSRTVESISKILDKMKNSDMFLNILDEQIWSVINETYSNKEESIWHIQIACDIQALNTSSSFVEALERYILNVIRIPLAKLLYKLELLGAIDSFFVDDTIKYARQSFWENMFKQEESVCITHIPDETGPDCYICETSDLSLEMPFSRIVFESIEGMRDDFLLEVMQLKVKCDLEMDAELPAVVLEEAFTQQESYMLKRVPYITQFNYEHLSEDYLKDFINLMSYSMCPGLPKLARIECTKWAMSGCLNMQGLDPLGLFVRLHCNFWTESLLYKSVLQLLDACKVVLEIDTVGIFEGLEQFNQSAKYIDTKSICPQNSNLENDVACEQNKETNWIVKSSTFHDDEKKDMLSKIDMDMSNNALEVNKLQYKVDSKNIENDSDESTQAATAQSQQEANNVQLDFQFSKQYDEENTETFNNKTKMNEQILQSSMLSVDLIPDINISEEQIWHDIFLKQSPDAMEVNKSQYKVDHDKNNEDDLDDSAQAATAQTQQEVNNMQLDFQFMKQNDEENTETFFDNKTEINEQILLSSMLSVELVPDINISEEQNWHGTLLKQSSDNLSSQLNFPLENEIEQNKFDNLVAFVCSKVLPTTDNIELFKGISSWQKQIRNIITLAAEISRKPAIFHALRFCDDLAQCLILPLSLDSEFLEHIGCYLEQNFDLDSENVFNVVHNVISSALETSSYECQKVFSQYLLRCIAANPSTRVYNFWFSLITDTHYFDEHIGLMKPPIYLLLQLQADDLLDDNCDETDETESCTAMLFIKMFKQNNVILAEDQTTDEINSILENAFLSDLENCLTRLYDNGRFESPFVILLVDIIQDIFDSAQLEQDTVIKLMFVCGKILQKCKYGIKYVAALAYIKSAIHNLVPVMKDAKNENIGEIIMAINAVYHSVNELPIQQTVLLFLLKTLRDSLVLCDLKKSIACLSKFHFLENLPWTDEYSSRCIEGNPLSVFVEPLFLAEKEQLMTQQNSSKTLEENMKALAKLSIENKAGLMLVFCLVLREFYLARYHTVVNATISTHSDILWEQINSGNHAEHQKGFFKCILGMKDFKCKRLMLDGVTSTEHYMKNSFLTSTYAVILANHDFSNRSILSLCLLYPSLLKDVFLPAFPEKSDCLPAIWKLNATLGSRVKLAQCSCGQHLAFVHQDDHNLYFCPNCNEILSELLIFDKEYEEIGTTESQKGFVTSAYMTEIDFCTRTLSPVSCNILFILIKGCLIGSLALEYSTTEEVQIVLGESVNTVDIEQHLWNEIDHHWANLRQLLNINDICLGIFFIALLQIAQNKLTRDLWISSLEERNNWEQEFENEVRKLMHDRFGVIVQNIQKCDKLLDLTSPSFEQFICEADERSDGADHQNTSFPVLFRLSNKPSKSDFIAQLLTSPKEFQFLVCVLKNEKRLTFPKHIYNIVQWHMAVTTCASYTIKSYECCKLNVQEFIKVMKESDKLNILQKRFDAFSETWNILKTQLHDCSFNDLPTLSTFHTQTKMSECLIFNETSIVYQVLSKLVAIQNGFLNECLMLSFVSDNFYHLSRNKHTSATSSVVANAVRKEHCIDIDHNWYEMLSQESHCVLKYGHGRHVQYDFNAIEKELVLELLVGKAYINISSLPTIVFTDELYKTFVSLTADVCANIKQEPLPSDILASVLSRNEEYPNMATDLLNHLGMIMTLLKKSKCDPHKSLLDFVEERKNILGRAFPKHLLPTPDINVKVCHIISLHEVLEELCAESKLEALDDELVKPLEQFMIDHFVELSKNKRKRAEIVTKALKRFVYRCLCMKISHFDQPLQKFLSEPSFWPCEMTDGIFIIAEDKVGFHELIPNGLLVCHVQAVIGLLEKQIETQKYSDNKMEKVITNWKNQDKPAAQKKNAKKRKSATTFRKA